jgi:hypothetical protein
VSFEPSLTNLTREVIEARMRPGSFSVSGFLGPHEKLDEVIERDARVLDELGITYDQLAASLERLIQAADASRGRPIRVPPHFEAQVVAYTGFQICPWAPDPHHAQCMAGGGVRNASLDWQITNLNTNQTMRGPGMIVHLIRDHHFFEGIESPYRVDPQKIASLLELDPHAG